ncbi:hypothetical protein [Photobacterium sp. OFAV2-7]|uniref:hypothetical protein n=1 Tax=Photobacterium sp. OFAV2-7 TaxID=2917748 RepID=UPI001EF5E4D1|nr:hypothetical protein [Photobacterium sp. OFAV2-7]MCG7588380.1 hypothetical protein [Photobacterium sp. OFAV2-7]
MCASRTRMLPVIALGLLPLCGQVSAAQENVPYCHSYAGLNFPDFMALWDYANPGRTENTFRALLNLAANSQDKTYMSELLSQIARTYVMRGKHEEAEFYLGQSYLYLSDSEPRAEANYLREKARLLIEQGRQQEAVAHLTSSWKIARESRYDRLAIEIALDLHELQPDGAYNWQSRAKQLAEKTRDAKALQWARDNQARLL